MAWSRGLLYSTALLILSCLHCIEVSTQVSVNEISGFSLSPPYFNLAEGSAISASATCGEDQTGNPRSDLFCKLVGGPAFGVPSQTIQGQFCDLCNGNNPDKAHPVTFAIDGTERWWQSPPLSRGLGYNEVNVTLDLGQLFHVAYIIIKFANSPRPDLWVLERSVDHGRSFTPWQYFAHSKGDCIEKFGRQGNGRILRDNDQICTTEYSRIVPLENGEVVVSLVNGRPGSKNFTYSPTLQDFTKATNIRLHFLRTNTLLGHLISKTQRDPTVTRRYYYSIKDISVGGRCVCHGHAQVCGARVPGQPTQLLCECQHNTCGESCDQCCPGYHQKPWRPATADNPNECEPCQCHSHATDCYYDANVARSRASLNIYGRYDGGGVCLSCQHHTAGVNCETCAPGFYRPHGVPPESPTGCTPCRCDSRTTAGCEMGSGRCVCKPQYSGENCHHCAHGYYHYPHCIPYPVHPTTTEAPAGNIFDPQCPVGFFGAPHCQPCVCEQTGTVPEVCSATGLCLCRPEVTGERCDQCRQGRHSFPYCQACRCDGPGVAESSCGPDGRCLCRSTHTGPQCERCAPGHYAYPTCAPCGCSREGSWETTCDPEMGQCVCRPGVAGRQCERCSEAHRSFPHCSEDSNLCNPAGSEVDFTDPATDSCVCLPYVEGPQCELCKPLYWNLAPENPRGCVECMCDVKGTLSGVGECQQESGECFCKPHTCSHACDTCQDGYFLLQKKNYFGCQGCQCDVGGAVGRGCEETTGRCQCRKHMRGRTCSEPELNFYLPGLHHMKMEAENGITANARPVRFGYDPREFPHFSWRGYALLTSAQPEVVWYLAVGLPGPFNIILRYASASLQRAVRGRLLLVAGAGFSGRCDWSRESKVVLFPPSRSPAFLTVPGDGFAQPFALTPGKWTACLQAEGVLLDYVVLLPSAYYEAAVLRQDVTEPCSYRASAERGSCLLYKHMPMDSFPSALASQGVLSVRGRRRRQTRVRQPTADHPELASISGRQAQLRLTLHIPESGSHVLVLEYASEVDIIQNVNVLISGWPWDQAQTRANIYSCAYSFLCRSVVIDAEDRIAHFLLPPKAEILVQAPTSSVLLYRVFAVPSAAFTMELVHPKVLCVSVHGRFAEDSKHCIQSQFPTPSAAVVVDAASATRPAGPAGQSPGRCDGLLLKSPQTQVELSVQVSQVGRYVFVAHYCQPEHPAFPVDVRLDAGNVWSGWLNASFCPAVSGCRALVIAEQRIALDVLQHTLTVSLKIPAGKTLTLDSILVVPEDAYRPELLSPEARDMSTDFISQCGAQGFSVDPHTSSEFCKMSARSLAAHYHNGALPCNCDKAGSMNPTCEPIGGQCPCRPHVIGRQCTRCATGFYGFPYCRPCECGRRLCDEVTGECICPPQTVRPACDVCESRTFSYHPLLGCEDCDCSLSGIPSGDSGQCHVATGQCICKPRVGGRQCSQCLPGFYGFPDCTPCSCDSGGVTPQICDPSNGRCLCKSNVEGARCATCRRGSFHFDPANPRGCTECFCFGATDQCRSSEKRRAKFVDMRSWRLVTSDLEEVTSVLNPLSNTVVADVQELSPSMTQLYWVLPQSYLGDRVSSYGGYLTYQTKSFGIPHEGMRLLDKQPDVVLKGQKTTLVYQDPQSPSPDRLYQGRVQLVEGNFRHSGTKRPVSREELMRVLAGLQGVWLRALHFSSSQRLSVGEVGLEEGSALGSGGPAHTVEVCVCPPQYAGDSCQRCAPGFYRDRSDRCLPCACNGLSDDCEERTGNCRNCQANTAGNHCERCKEGYHGSAALRTCQICRCPHGRQGNNFAEGCREVNGRFQCLCKPGYTGERCERCAPGYYGDPEVSGGSCRPCNCNGNSCSPKTGVCSNSQEPKDTNTHEECPVCDSCAETLLIDLEQLDDKLAEIKAQLEDVNSSFSAHDRLKKLEEAIAAMKNVVTDYGTAVDRLSPKVADLEQDSQSLMADINLLKQQAEKRSKDAQKAIENVENTHQKAKDLNTQALDLLKKIKELLKQLSDSESGGGTVPGGDSARLLEEAERMVREMEARRFGPQKTAAEKELDEAQKLLEYIKNNCTKQLEQNQETAKKIGGLLKDFEAKLKELEDALKEAKDLVQKANSQNSLNSQDLGDLLKRIKNLEKERDNVATDIIVAKRQLKDTDDLLKKLGASKKEYEQLAAQLDGAKTDLTERVNNISRAAAKESLVKRAEDHAALLNRLAGDLQEAIQNSSGRADVKDALAAIDAYKNITEAVNAAEEAAKKAKEAADKAQNDVSQGDIPNRAKNLKDKSNKLLKDAKNAAKDLKQITEDLTTQQERLEAAEKKKATLEKELLAITDGLKGIERDDIASTIDAAKRAAAAANASATDTLDKLRSISDEVAKISTTPAGSNIDRMLDDVDMTVKNLSSSIPSLLAKITQVENLSSQIDPNNNISNNINRIKELIEQARDAANRIAIPMKFTGSEYVELRPPKNLADVRAYTAFNLLLQRPKQSSRGDDRRRRRRQTTRDTGDLFVLYLGNRDTSKDYLGMALRSNVLYFIYKLDGNVYEMETDVITDSDPEPAFFDKVDVYRIYQDAEVNLTKLFTSNRPDDPLSKSNQGQPNYNLLDLDPNEVVFYVGGYPDDFTPPDPLKYPKYRGCIELSTFNERFISLYNFKALKPDNVTLQVPCKRYVQPVMTEYFEGSGYAKVKIDKVLRSLVLSLSVESRAENAVLLYIGDENSFYSITLEQGYMVLRGRDGDKVLETKKSKKKQDASGDLKVILESATQLIRVRMQNTEILTGSYSPRSFSNYYIGGIPRDLRERDNITTVPLKGCVFSMNTGGKTANITEKVGVSRGCPKEMLTSRKAEFCTGGSLETPPGDFDLAGDVTLSLGFRSTEKDSLLLQNKQAGQELGLSMVNGFVMLKNQGTVWRSKKHYQDGEWHYLTVIKRGSSVELRVDEEDVGETVSDSLALSFSSDNIILGKGSLTGCLANLYMRRPSAQLRAQDLSTFTSTGDVLLDVCNAAPPPQSMLASRGQTRPQKHNTDKLKHEEESACHTPAALGHSFNLAGVPSSATFRMPPAALSAKPFFSLDVRTRSAEGLLLYSPAEQEKYHLALYVSKGRIRLSIGRRREIFNREKYSDGKWHTVTLSLEKRRFRLVIDGLQAQDGLLAPGESSSIQLSSDVYLGTPPKSTHADLKWKLLPEHGVVGCIRNFKMNGLPVVEPAVNHGVGPCFEGQTESGAYFSGQGAYVIADDSLVLGKQTFELVFELRPSTDSGLLLHVGDSQHVTVFMRRGEVVAQVNKGGGEFSVVVRPKQPLCDGVFHRIAVIQRSNVVEMHVDTEGRYKIGPSTSAPITDSYPVYVGGVPDHAKFSTLPISESYVGCLQNVMINGAVVVLEKLSGVFGSVNLRECPSNLRRPQPSHKGQPDLLL